MFGAALQSRPNRAPSRSAPAAPRREREADGTTERELGGGALTARGRIKSGSARLAAAGTAVGVAEGGSGSDGANRVRRHGSGLLRHACAPQADRVERARDAFTYTLFCKRATAVRFIGMQICDGRLR